MSILLTIGLALTLSLDAYVIAAGCSKVNKIAYTHGLVLTLCFSFLHTLFLVGGFFLGKVLASGNATMDVWIAVGILFFVGIKLTLRALRKQKDDSTSFVTGSKSILFLSLATSVDFLITGIALGLLKIGDRIWWLAAMLLFFTIVSTFFGVLVGRQKYRKSRRWWTVIEGALLVAAAVHFLMKIGV